MLVSYRRSYTGMNGFFDGGGDYGGETNTPYDWGGGSGGDGGGFWGPIIKQSVSTGLDVFHDTYGQYHTRPGEYRQTANGYQYTVPNGGANLGVNSMPPLGGSSMLLIAGAALVLLLVMGHGR